MKTLHATFILVALFFGVSGMAQAAEKAAEKSAHSSGADLKGSFLVRLKGNLGWTVTPFDASQSFTRNGVNGGVGASLDAAFISQKGWGVALKALVEDPTSGFKSRTFIGVAPSYSVSSGALRMTFGLGVGSSLFVQGINYEGPYGPSGSVYFKGTISRKDRRIAIAPSVDLDIALSDSWGANVGFQVINTWDDWPNYSFFAPTLGATYRF